MFGVLVVEDEPVIAQQLATCVTGNRWLTLAGTAATEQDAIDTARSSHPLPAGLLRETLDAVVTVLRAAERPLRAEEIAARSGLKRETANRYLIYLSDQGIAVRAPEHGRPGHPAYLYTLAAMWNAPATP